MGAQQTAVSKVKQQVYNRLISSSKPMWHANLLCLCSLFGVKVVSPQLLLKSLPKLFEAKQEPVRDGAKNLTVSLSSLQPCCCCYTALGIQAFLHMQ